MRAIALGILLLLTAPQAGAADTASLRVLICTQDGSQGIKATVTVAGRTADSGGDGWVQFDDLPLGTVTIHASAPGWSSGDKEFNHVGGATANLRLTQDQAGGTGQSGATGQSGGTGHLRVLVSDRPGSHGINAKVTINGVTVQTDAGGWADFGSMPLGHYTVNVQADGWAIPPFDYNLTSGGDGVASARMSPSLGTSSGGAGSGGGSTGGGGTSGGSGGTTVGGIGGSGGSGGNTGGGSGGSGGGGDSCTNDPGPDAFDLTQAKILWGPTDVGSWPVTTRITGVDSSQNDLNIIFSKKDGPCRWPDVIPPGWDGPIEYTIWFLIKKNGVWNAAGVLEMWNGRDSDGNGGMLGTQIGRNWTYGGWWAAAGLKNAQPNENASIAFFVTAGDTRGMDTHRVRERSNVILLPFSSGPAHFGAR